MNAPQLIAYADRFGRSLRELTTMALGGQPHLVRTTFTAAQVDLDNGDRRPA